MKSRLNIICALIILFLWILAQHSFAKYTLDNQKTIQVYIDKTPPIITLKSSNMDKSYSKTDLDNIIQINNDITITTSDNIKIDYNEYYYNSTKDFNNVNAVKFESGKIFTEEGYYKVISVDTRGNRTEIIFMLDKTPPDVQVNYLKKGELVGQKQIIKVAAKRAYKSAENVVETESPNNENAVALASTSTWVYNENDFRQAINNKVSNIITATSINFSQPIYINYAVTVSPVSTENALRATGGGNLFIIQNGGSLTLDAMVVDGRSYANNNAINCINIQSGGNFYLKGSTIIDAGTSNIGILLNSGGKATLYSGSIVYAKKGIVVKSNSGLIFGNLNDGRTTEFWSNSTAISFESFTNTCNFNQSNIIVRNNTNGIVVESSTGTVNVSNGQYYSNSSNAITSKAGNFNVSGGNIYNNGTGINFGAGNLKVSGGSIYSNSTGVILNSSYTGKFTMTGGSIRSNSNYAINHGQNADGCCTITGGTVDGIIFLGQKDNYINTNSSYPTLKVTPSSYYFKRKLVRTNSNAYANNEKSKVTMTPNGSYYTYVEDEYIKVWSGGNVLIKHKDYYGNILETEVLNGNIGENYQTTPKELEGYDLINIPTNATGKYTTNDISVEYKYDLKNIAKITFEDLLSGVKIAKYWYNATNEEFSGDGIIFENNKIFEDYGYYKVIVENNVGLKKELIFILNKDSLTR